MPGEADNNLQGCSSGTPKGYRVKNVRWEDDSGQGTPSSSAAAAVPVKDNSKLASDCKCDAEQKGNEKADDAQKNASSPINPNVPLEKEAFEKAHNLQPLMPGWYLHRSANPMASLGRSPFTTWAPVQVNNHSCPLPFTSEFHPRPPASLP
jgi:hypothetical protein